MSIRTYGIFNTNSSGNRGYPTADVTGIVLRSLSGLKAGIRWTDPDDTVLDNAVLSDWASTVVIRKDGSVPENIKDGVVVVENTIKDQYKETEFIDSNGLEGGHTYYYRFFTKSASGVIGDGSPTVKMTAKAISPILSENDWATIIEVAESGAAPEIWKVGDEIDITLSGTYNETVTLQIWDFNHYDKVDGTGKTAITFGMKNLLRDVQWKNGYFFHSSGDATPAFSTLGDGFYNSLPAEVRMAVKQIDCKRYQEYQYVTDRRTAFIPSGGETGARNDKNEGNPFPIFPTAESRIKKLDNGAGSAYGWLTSTITTATGSWAFEQINVIYTNGRIAGKSIANSSGEVTVDFGLCFAFNV